MDDEDVLSFGSERAIRGDRRRPPRRAWVAAASVAAAALLAGTGIALSSAGGQAATPPHHSQLGRTGGSVYADLPVVQTVAIDPATGKVTEPRGYPRCKGH
jgi:hypothetical protein